MDPLEPAIHVTSDFDQELMEVKNMIAKQLSNKNSIIKTYQSLLIDFLTYRSII